MTIATSASGACKKLLATVADFFSLTNHSGACNTGKTVANVAAMATTGCINTITSTTTYTFSDDANQCDASFSFITCPELAEGPVTLGPSKIINHLPLPINICKNSFMK